MDFKFTVKDVGRKVLLKDNSIVIVQIYDEDAMGLSVKLSNGGWYYKNGTSTGAYAERSVVDFADQSPSFMTEERVREIIREMLQPQPEKKEPLRGECWVNIYPEEGIRIQRGEGPKHYAEVHLTREGADRKPFSSFGTQRLACVKFEWTEGQGLEGEAR
ncbi:hypothetical protein [Methylobacterium sp. Gmos1]